MPESIVQLRLFTGRQGALAAVGHDLEIHAQPVVITTDGGWSSLTAVVAMDQLVVVRAVTGGRVRSAKLSDRDRRKIAQRMHSEVLQTHRFPTATLDVSAPVTWRVAGMHIAGQLTLCGSTHPIALKGRKVGEKAVLETTVHMPSFGIAPVTALLGSLRVDPDVRVVAELPWPSATEKM